MGIPSFILQNRVPNSYHCTLLTVIITLRYEQNCTCLQITIYSKRRGPGSLKIQKLHGVDQPLYFVSLSYLRILLFNPRFSIPAKTLIYYNFLIRYKYQRKGSTIFSGHVSRISTRTTDEKAPRDVTEKRKRTFYDFLLRIRSELQTRIKNFMYVHCPRINE